MSGWDFGIVLLGVLQIVGFVYTEVRSHKETVRRINWAVWGNPEGMHGLDQFRLLRPAEPSTDLLRPAAASEYDAETLLRVKP